MVYFIANRGTEYRYRKITGIRSSVTEILQVRARVMLRETIERIAYGYESLFNCRVHSKCRYGRTFKSVALLVWIRVWINNSVPGTCEIKVPGTFEIIKQN